MFLPRLFVADAECGVKVMVLLGRKGVQGGRSPTWLKRAGRTAKKKKVPK